MLPYDRVYASVDLDAFHHNLQVITSCICEETKIIAVIKTDGYGHGAVYLAREMEQMERVWGYATATVEEAMQLRQQGIKKPVLILGFSYPGQYETMILHDIRPAVFKYETARALSETALRLGKEVLVHIKLDTGMNRIGYRITEENADEIAEIAKLPNLRIEGMFSHFAKADEADKTHAIHQQELYDRMVQMLKKRSVQIDEYHLSNSAGIIDLPGANMNLVRAGIILYGLWPSDEVEKERADLKPLLELKSQVIYLKDVKAGETISYGGTYTFTRDSKVATIPVGYGDGYPRALSNKGYVLIRGKRANIVGRVCMDQFMVDVTDIPDVQEQDVVTLIGKDADQQITMEELGEISGRFNYEFACDLGKRIPRVYYKNGTII